MSEERDFIYTVSDLLPSYLKPASQQAKKFATRYVTTNKGVELFDWPRFRQAAVNYSDDDIKVVKSLSHEIKQDNVSVSAICDAVVTYIRDNLGLTQNDELVHKMRSDLEDALTSLKEHGSGFLYSESKYHSSQEYRVMHAFPYPDSRHVFYSLIVTVELQANITEESSWWGLTGSSTKGFSAKITAMQLTVVNTFMDLDGN